MELLVYECSTWDGIECPKPRLSLTLLAAILLCLLVPPELFFGGIQASADRIENPMAVLSNLPVLALEFSPEFYAFPKGNLHTNVKYMSIGGLEREVKHFIHSYLVTALSEFERGCLLSRKLPTTSISNTWEHLPHYWEWYWFINQLNYFWVSCQKHVKPRKVFER